MSGTPSTLVRSAVPQGHDAEERALRHRKLRAAMAEQDLGVLLAYAPGWRRENVRYLSDAEVLGSATFALLAADGQPSAYSTRKADIAVIEGAGWIEDVHHLVLSDIAPLTARLRDAKPKRVGIAHLELLPFAFSNALRAALPATQFVSATSLMDNARMVKSSWELARMRRSGEVCAAGWKKFVEVLEPGLSEYHIIAHVESELKKLGAEDNFMLIASGGDG